MEERRTAATTNAFIGSYWLFHGLELLEIDASEPRAKYIFSDPDGRADDLSSRYWRGDAAAFVSCRMHLKRALRRALAGVW